MLTVSLPSSLVVVVVVVVFVISGYHPPLPSVGSASNAATSLSVVGL